MRSLSSITRRLISSRAARNAAASYFAFFSASISAFVSIPIVVRFLEKEQIGLWMIINQIVGYLLWMDLGIGNAAGRKLADAIIADDQPEINRWWTAIVFALGVLGFVLILTGLLLAPAALGVLRIPTQHLSDARYLLNGVLLLTGLFFPLKAASGFLTAQDRFHWCPISQGLMPWVNLIIFYLCLRSGLGVRSYVWSLAASQVFALVYYLPLIKFGPQSPVLDRSGLARARLRSLFGYSLNLSVLSFVESIVQSLPAMILSRAGGLALVPIYSFTARGPTMLTGLVRRTTHAFYPALMRLHVSGRNDEFRSKYQKVALLTLAIGAVAAGMALAGNRMFVEFLAGPGFYAGNTTNLWFIASIITGPLCGLFQILLQMSGSMGKTALIAPLRLLIGWFAALMLFHWCGMPGIAMVFAFVPFVYGIYSYHRGCSNCGHTRKQLVRRPMVVGFAITATAILAGVWAILAPSTGIAVKLHKHAFTLPGTAELAAGSVLIAIGLVLGLRQIRALASS